MERTPWTIQPTFCLFLRPDFPFPDSTINVIAINLLTKGLSIIDFVWKIISADWSKEHTYFWSYGSFRGLKLRIISWNHFGQKFKFYFIKALAQLCLYMLRAARQVSVSWQKWNMCRVCRYWKEAHSSCRYEKIIGFWCSKWVYCRKHLMAL